MPRLQNANSYRKASMETILKTAKDVVEKELERSSVIQTDKITELCTFDPEELVLGKVVGRGGFCVVREINAVRLNAGSSNRSKTSSSIHSNGRGGGKLSFLRGGSFPSSEPSAQTLVDGSVVAMEARREFLARRVWAKRNGHTYVVKQVESDLKHTDRVTYLKGIVDLALETHYLASLSHPHILSIVGLSRMGPFESTSSSYFLILDQLSMTLSKRLNSWMHQKRAASGITGALTGGRKKAQSLLIERLLVAYDIADAVDYLHLNRIIYRDLKPDNIGFDAEGTVKLFDFGLAKELLEEERTESGLYRMTGFTGAIRYMAPEVGLKRLYDLRADVYSFSMILWYIMALEPPMGMYTVNMFVERVFRLGYRPAIKDKWPAGISNLMRQCWSQQISDRPSFHEIMQILKKEIAKIDPTASAILSESGEFRLVAGQSADS